MKTKVERKVKNIVIINVEEIMIEGRNIRKKLKIK
jgi:hypothetical protein